MEQPENLKETLRGFVADYRTILRPLMNVLMPVAALAVLFIVIQSIMNVTYALNIEYRDKHLAYVSNESVYMQAQAAAESHIKPKPEIAEQQTAESEETNPEEEKETEEANLAGDVRYNIVQVQPEDLTSAGILTDQLLENTPQEMTSACGIYIGDKDGNNRRLFATIKNSTDAEGVLNSIKNMKTNHLKPDPSRLVRFVQSVDLVQGYYPTAELKDAQTLLNDLLLPNSQEVQVPLQQGETVETIISRYNISRMELHQLNAWLKDADETKLKPGTMFTVKSAVPNLEVKTIQTETRTQEVPFNTIDKDNYNLYRGEIRIMVLGVPGIDKVTERVTYINGVRSGTPELILRETIKKPVDQQRDIGRKSTTISIKGGGKITINPSALGFTWPVPACSTVSSPYGYRRRGFHSGIDIANGRTNGKIIVAAKDGTVEMVQLGGNGYGNQVVINHGNGVKTRYAHMMSGSVSVSRGQRVSIGQPIGRVGSTGNSTGPHLHFEVIINGSTQNPLNYVRRP